MPGPRARTSASATRSKLVTIVRVLCAPSRPVAAAASRRARVGIGRGLELEKQRGRAVRQGRQHVIVEGQRLVGDRAVRAAQAAGRQDLRLDGPLPGQRQRTTGAEGGAGGGGVVQGHDLQVVAERAASHAKQLHVDLQRAGRDPGGALFHHAPDPRQGVLRRLRVAAVGPVVHHQEIMRASRAGRSQGRDQQPADQPRPDRRKPPGRAPGTGCAPRPGLWLHQHRTRTAKNSSGCTFSAK